MTYREADGRAVFTVHPAQGERSLIPSKRSFTVELTGFADAAGAVEVKVGETAASAQSSYDSFRRILTVTVEDVPWKLGWRSLWVWSTGRWTTIPQSGASAS